MNKFYFSFLFLIGTTLSFSQTNLSLGEVMISGYYGDSTIVEDGCGDGFSFVSYVPLAPGTIIRFSEADYHQWPDDNEGDLRWENTTGSTIAALTNITIITHNEELSCASSGPEADLGTATFEQPFSGTNWSLSSSNEELIIYQGPGPRAANTFISMFLSDATSTFPTNVPAPLLNSNTFITFESIDDDCDVAVYTGPTTFSSLADFRAQFTNVSANWASQDEGGVDNGKDGVFPDFPDDLQNFPGNLSTTDFDNISIRFFPNPVSERFFIESKLNISKVVLYNTIGKKVFEDALISEKNNQIDMSEFQSGIYFLKVSMDDVTQTLKVIKR